MAYNLLEERWIPVRASDGTLRRIAPWEITSVEARGPLVAVDSPRADFNGTLVQFLIGLVQTSGLIPTSDPEWSRLYRSPPEGSTLREAFLVFRDAFLLDGDGPRFLQDLTLREGTEWPIRDLLIDPSGNEHFIKPREGNGFCFACTAAALHCLQTNAPEGGRGHFTGLRGGGPLTTLVLPPQDNLWETIWINVLSREDFLSNGMPDRPTEESDIFPWLAPSRSGEKKSGQPTLPEDCHPLQVYWSIPRRIRIDFSCLEKGSCDICRTQSENLVQRFIARPYGVSYEGPWQHPLTPYSFDQKGVPFARKAREGSISYRNWVGLVLTGSGDDNAKVQYRPARVVEKFSQVRKRVLGKRTTARLWGFGYDMEHKRARCWFDGRMPLPAIPDERIAARYSLHSERMVKGANIIASNLRQSLKEAFFRYTEQARGDTRFVDTPFYTVSEPLFFEHLEKLIRELEESESERPTRALSAWHRKLCDLALKLFDDYVNSSPIEDQDPSRIARARNKLKYRNRGNTVRAILGLPQEPQERQEPVSS